MGFIRDDLQIYLEENFLSEEEIAYFLDVAYNYGKKPLEFFNEKDPGYTFWNDKNIELHKLENIDKELVSRVSEKTYERLISNFPESKEKSVNFLGINMIHKFTAGQFMGEHTDRGPAENGNNTVEYGFVLYLNDEYSGGELNYTKLNLKIKPSRGMLVIHPSDSPYEHEVLPVVGGSRYTITSFALSGD